MKLYMMSLKRDARPCYMTSLPACIVSLLYAFRQAFKAYWKIFFPAEDFFENCCEGRKEEPLQ